MLSEIVPLDVIVPPLKPVPAVTLVTVPPLAPETEEQPSFCVVASQVRKLPPPHEALPEPELLISVLSTKSPATFVPNFWAEVAKPA